MNVFAVMDLVGVMAFVFGGVFAYMNYSRTREISPVWLAMLGSMALGGAWSLAKALEWMEFYPLITDITEDLLFAALAVSLAWHSLRARRSSVKPVA